MAQAYFVTGTDTEVGKTTIAAGLLHAARSAGLSRAASVCHVHHSFAEVDGTLGTGFLGHQWTRLLSI